MTTNPKPTTKAAPTAAPTPEPVPAAAPLAPRDKTPVRMGVAPTTIDEAWRLSQYLANSDIVPKQYVRKPGDVLVAMQMGMELGFSPMQALQSIAVINGRAAVWGDGLLALIVASGLYQDHDEFFEVDGERRDGLVADDLKKDTTSAVCIFLRHHKATPITARFSIGQAKKAGLWTKEGPWITYPDRMLKMRARGFAARDGFSDLLRGVKTAEELYDTPEDAPPIVREVRRASDRPAAVPHPPTPEPVRVGPLAVTNVEQFMGGFTITLTDGTKIDTIEAADALELEKVKGEAHKFVFTCDRADGVLQLRAFAIAD
jgi:hypothetical protein